MEFGKYSMRKFCGGKWFFRSGQLILITGIAHKKLYVLPVMYRIRTFYYKMPVFYHWRKYKKINFSIIISQICKMQLFVV